MATVLSIELITIDETVRGGRPCVAGTSLRVTDVAIAYVFHGRTADQIAVDYKLSLAQVHAALSYYFDHKQSLDQDIRLQLQDARHQKAQHHDGQTSLLS